MLNWPAMTRQRMGQHFLTGESWLERILAALPREKDETWIEIGAGHGEMTRRLAARSRRLIAIEADLKLAQSLQEAQQRQPDDWRGVEIVSGNVLEMDLAELAGGNFRVYGSLPYYITSPILHLFFGCAERLKSAHIVIQLEVAERIVAQSGQPRVCLSFRSLPILYATGDCVPDSSRRISSSAARNVRASEHDSAGGAVVARRRRRG